MEAIYESTILRTPDHHQRTPKLKRLASSREKTSANKWLQILVSRKKWRLLHQSLRKELMTHIKNVKRYEQAFQEETNKHVKRCSTSLVIKGMYTKTTKRNSETNVTCQTARKLLQSSCITSEGHKASLYQPKWATWTPTRTGITKHSNPNMFKSTNAKWLLKKKNN